MPAQREVHNSDYDNFYNLPDSGIYNPDPGRQIKTSQHSTPDPIPPSASPPCSRQPSQSRLRKSIECDDLCAIAFQLPLRSSFRPSGALSFRSRPIPVFLSISPFRRGSGKTPWVANRSPFLEHHPRSLTSLFHTNFLSSPSRSAETGRDPPTGAKRTTGLHFCFLIEKASFR